MQLYAHRGASQRYPENTLEAFAEAMRLDVDGIELDIHATADGVPVVIHDVSLNRTFGIDTPVTSLSLAELRNQAPAVPTFAQVLELVGPAVHFDIEVKQPAIEQAVLNVLGQFPESRWSISSFDWSVIERFRVLDPSCDLWLLSSMPANDDLLDTAHRLHATTAALQANTITRGSVNRVHAAGLMVMAWTVNDVERAQQLGEWGVDAFCTDAPQLFIH